MLQVLRLEFPHMGAGSREVKGEELTLECLAKVYAGSREDETTMWKISVSEVNREIACTNYLSGQWLQTGGRKHRTSFFPLVWFLPYLLFASVKKGTIREHEICCRQSAERIESSRNPSHEDQPSHTHPQEKKTKSFFVSGVIGLCLQWWL